MTSVRASLDSAALMDRGGRPTVRELLTGLEFDAVTGALRLNGARVMLQHSEADRVLRRELISALGEEEARVFLLRRGYQMGQHDAAFVARSWPALDRGDAFTAGTRLHMFSGIVRVETVHNDFDFARGRFSAEFLWHNSLEAESARSMARIGDRPACWQQLGYASGYASHFFGALVVYKETACAAQGHKSCRVVGRLAEGWGEDDPEVMLFRNRILTAQTPETRVPPAPAAAPVAPDTSDALLIAPLLPELQRAARLPLPCLIAGPGRAGQAAAMAHLQRLAGPGAEVQRLDGAATDAEAIRAAQSTPRKPRRKEPQPLVLLERVEALSTAAQAELARALGGSDPLSRPRLIASSDCGLRDLAAGAILPGLWVRLAPLSMELPGFSERLADLPDLAARRLQGLAAQLDLPHPATDPGAFGSLASDPPPEGLDGLDALLTALLVESLDGSPISAALVARVQARIAPLTPPPMESPSGWVEAQLLTGKFSLEAHEARIRAAALAQAGGNLAAAARLLGISRAQLAYREKAGKA